MLLVRDKRREVLALQDVVARNLEYNADIVARYPRHTSIQSVMAELDLTPWEQARERLHVLSRRDHALWDDLSTTYGNLARTKARGSDPASADLLLSLAERLRASRL